ncbi:glycosyltransferase family 2 protein [Asaia sp. BMEF1]|uniref:glycosyltransferase family 2 protein n=1 Tax=Asaia sp. BMEF1 TaxID=3155932 RepID=UPI003F67AFAA
MASFQLRMDNGARVTCRVAKIVTDHQTLLDLDPDTQVLAHRSADFPRETLALRWSSAPGFTLLVASDGAWPEAPSETGRGGWSPGFMPLSVVSLPDGKVALKRYRGAFFLRAEIDTGCIYADCQVISGWERFVQVPVGVMPGSCLQDFALQFAALLAGRDEPLLVLKALASFPVSFQPRLLDMLGDFLGPDVLKSFAGLFTSAPEGSVAQRCSALLASLPASGWIADGFRRLREWQSGSYSPFQSAGACYDFLGFQENTRRDSPYSHGARLLSAARRNIAPRKALALLATARDEGVYLLEWIAHHRRIGVEQFFIYTNDLTDGSDVLLRCLADAGEIIWIDNSGASPERINMQDKAYHHALMILPEILDYRWCLVVDLDEVVLPVAEVDYCLPPLLEAREREGAEAVAMSWRVFNSNGHLTWAPGLSAERFVATETHPLIKTAFRTNLFSGASAHHPLSRERDVVTYMTIDGERQKNGDLADHDTNFAARPTVNASICHYHVRSLEEYVWKFARGENDGSGVLKQKHFRYNNPGIFDLFTTRFEAAGDQPVRVLSEDIHRGIRRLLGLPGVAEAQAEIERRFQSQSLAFVEQSARIMRQDDRIAADVREKWCALVDEWRVLRAAE